MTVLEVILSVAVAGMIVLQGITLKELHDLRVALLLRKSQRREWGRKEHND